MAACAGQPIQHDVTRLVSLHGTVYDSTAMVPLRAAHVSLISGDTIRAVTDTSGAFVVSLHSGTWRAEISHPRFDSLRITLPARQFELPAKATVSEAFWTPSRRTISRMLCGDSSRMDDVAVAGIVRDAATRRAIDGARVSVEWVNLTLQGGHFARTTEKSVVQTGHDGWYVSCGVPVNATVLSWAEHEGALSGTIPLTLEGVATRQDITLDHTARLLGGSIDLEPDSNGVALFPIAYGKLHYRVLVRDAGGRPVSSARVRMLGKRTMRTNDAGMVTLDFVAGGTQTLEVLAIGYQPQRRTVDIAAGREPTDTVVLTSLQSLDTIRVVASRDPAGFERRRNSVSGQFLTAADIEKENPPRTTWLFRQRDGLRMTSDRRGFPFLAVTTQVVDCKPLILVDGFPANPVPTVPGEAAIDWLVHPDEIGGVEMYNSAAKIPPELARWGRVCGVVAFWTREALGLPRSVVLKP